MPIGPSVVNDRLFPVELTEIADWRSMSEYVVHSNFGKNLDKGHRREFRCKYLYIAASLNVCLPFWMFYQWKEYLKKKYFGISANKLISFQIFDRPTRVVLFEFSQ